MGFFDKVFGAKKEQEKISEPARNMDWRGPKKGLCRFEVRGSYQIPSLGTVAVGIVQEGILKPGLSFNADEKAGKILRIERRNAQVEQAVTGELVNIAVEGVAKQDIIAGSVLEFF